MNELEEKALRLAELARQIRLDALDMALAAGSGGSHVGGSLSCVEILAVLYGEVLRFDVKNPLDPGRDRFIPSKTTASWPTSRPWRRRALSPLRKFWSSRRTADG